MDNRSWLSGAAGLPPTAPVSPSAGYPTAGNPGVTPPTNPGPYWFHQIGEELRAVIVGAGLTPSASNLAQLLSAIRTVSIPPVQAGRIDLAFGGSSAGITYASRYCEFIERGKNIEFWAAFSLSSKGSATGTAAFTLERAVFGPGIPAFPAPKQLYAANVHTYQMNAIPGTPTVVLQTSANEFRYFNGSEHTQVLTDAHFTNSSVVYVQGSYLTA